MTDGLHCPKNTWCKRFAHHSGDCKRKATKKDMERVFGSELTPAEEALRRRLGGR